MADYRIHWITSLGIVLFGPALSDLVFEGPGVQFILEVRLS